MKRIDYSRFMNKTTRVKLALRRSIPMVLDKATDDVMKRTMRNLSGPHIPPKVSGKDDQRIGKMPIPRRTSLLARSMTIKKLTWAIRLIYADVLKCSYAPFVHNGHRIVVFGRRTNKFAKPRRYLGDVIRERRMAWQNRMRYEIITAIRKAGR